MGRVKLIAILEFLVFLFLFLNTFVIDINIFGQPLRYYICILVFVLSIIIKQTINRHIVFFMLTVFTIAILLLFYSVVMIGNEISNAMWFIKPYLILLIIPGLNILFNEYGIRKYIRVFNFSVLLLCLYFCFIIVLYHIYNTMAVAIDNRHDLLQINIVNNNPRIIIKTFVFILPLFYYILLYNKNNFIKIISAILVLYLIILSQTYGLIIGMIISLLIYFLIRRKYLHFIFCTIILLTMFILLWKYHGLYLNKFKMHSIMVKIQQFQSIFKDMSLSNIILGKGVGAVMQNMDLRGLKEDFVIEVAPVLLFRVGGIIFSAMIIYVYFYHALYGLWICLNDYKNDVFYFVISQFAIVFSSFANPYIWSGGIGLLMITFLAAYVPLIKVHYEG